MLSASPFRQQRAFCGRNLGASAGVTPTYAALSYVSCLILDPANRLGRKNKTLQLKRVSLSDSVSVTFWYSLARMHETPHKCPMWLNVGTSWVVKRWLQMSMSTHRALCAWETRRVRKWVFVERLYLKCALLHNHPTTISACPDTSRIQMI